MASATFWQVTGKDVEGDLDYLTHEVSFVPDAAGSYTWGGVVVHPEDEKEYYFMGSFLVEE